MVVGWGGDVGVEGFGVVVVGRKPWFGGLLGAGRVLLELLSNPNRSIQVLSFILTLLFTLTTLNYYSLLFSQEIQPYTPIIYHLPSLRGLHLTEIEDITESRAFQVNFREPLHKG